MGKGFKRVSKEEKKIVLGLVRFLEDLKKEIWHNHSATSELGRKYGNVLKLAAEITNKSISTITRIVSAPKIDLANQENETSSSSNKKLGRPKLDCDEFTVSALRRITLNLYNDKTYHTVEKIWKETQSDPNFPKVSQSSIGRWRKEKAKFKFKKINRKPVFLKRRDIKAQRELYLLQIDYYRKNGYKIFYTDETWACPDHAPSKIWHFHLDPSGYLLKGGAGRAIVNHAGSEDGFLHAAEDIFESKKDTKDYHNSLNGEHYLDWFHKLVAALPDKSVVVVDQAPYHKLRVENTIMPKMYWLKQKIIDNLMLRKIPLPQGVSSFAALTKAALIKLSEQFPVKPKYLIEDIAKKSGKNIHILWLPVAHYELNAIELVWAYFKRYVAKKNSVGGTKKVVELCKEACTHVTPELWRNCIQHVIKVVNYFRERDRVVDKIFYDNDSVVEPSNEIVINIDDNDDWFKRKQF